ncbi:MAG: polymer-forming cytoskeletal protein [Sphingomonadaceae bacterium]
MAWGGKSGGPSGASGSGGSLSFIGSEVTITGNISGKGDLHLDGSVEGDIHCASLILGSGGRIKGNISAETATLGGTVGGTVSARTMIIEKTARISGDLSYESVSIETGALVDGRLTQRSGEGQLKLVSSSE